MNRPDPYGSFRVTIESDTENVELVFAFAELWIAGNPEQFAAKVGMDVRDAVAVMLGIPPRDPGNGNASPGS